MLSRPAHSRLSSRSAVGSMNVAPEPEPATGSAYIDAPAACISVRVAVLELLWEFYQVLVPVLVELLREPHLVLVPVLVARRPFFSCRTRTRSSPLRRTGAKPLRRIESEGAELPQNHKFVDRSRGREERRRETTADSDPPRGFPCAQR